MGRTVDSGIDFFIRQTAKQVMVDESIVDLIIRDQWKHANIAARDLKEIEIKDIGTFYPSWRKMATKVRAYKKMLDHLVERESIENININLLRMEKTKHYDKTRRYLEEQDSNS